MLEALSDMERTKLAIEASFYAVGIVAAGGSAWSYWRNSNRERARWLFELYQCFYEKADLKPIWRRIDKKDFGFLHPDADTDDLAAFDDLLNFFEVIAVLKERRELRKKDVCDLFAYPLTVLRDSKAIREYLEEWDYEHLAKLLDEFGYAGCSAGTT